MTSKTFSLTRYCNEQYTAQDALFKRTMALLDSIHKDHPTGQIAALFIQRVDWKEHFSYPRSNDSEPYAPKVLLDEFLMKFSAQLRRKNYRPDNHVISSTAQYMICKAWLEYLFGLIKGVIIPIKATVYMWKFRLDVWLYAWHVKLSKEVTDVEKLSVVAKRVGGSWLEIAYNHCNRHIQCGHAY